MSKKNVHTTWDTEGSRWKNKLEDSDEALGYYDIKEEAATAGQAEARRLKVDWVDHNKNGQIIGGNSYGNDPHPPAG